MKQRTHIKRNQCWHNTRFPRRPPPAFSLDADAIFARLPVPGGARRLFGAPFKGRG